MKTPESRGVRASSEVYTPKTPLGLSRCRHATWRVSMATQCWEPLDSCKGGKAFAKRSPGSWCLSPWALGAAATRGLSVEGSLPAPHPLPPPPRHPSLQVPSVAPFLAGQVGFPGAGGCAEYLGSVLTSQNPGDKRRKIGIALAVRIYSIYTHSTLPTAVSSSSWLLVSYPWLPLLVTRTGFC